MADVTSVTGNIIFDVNSDSTSEMILSADGLAIGTTVSSANLTVSGNSIIENNLFVGTTAGNSALHINGSIGLNIQSVSTNTLLSGNSIVLVDTSNGNLLLTLPTPESVKGRVYNIKKVSNSNNLIISSFIDNSTSLTLESGSSTLPAVSLISSGNHWYTLNSMTTPTTTSSDNLIGWWTMDDATGTTEVRDSSNNKNHLGVGNNATILSGKLGNAAYFDGADDYIRITDPPDGSLDVGSGNFSISAWIKADSGNDSFATIVYKGGLGPTTAGYWFFLLNGKIRTQVSNGTTKYDFTGATDLRDDTWHHVLTRMNPGGTSQMYLDGAFHKSAALGVTGSLDATEAFEIGCRGTVVEEFFGFIDDVRVFNKYLSDDEIQELYNLGAP